MDSHVHWLLVPDRWMLIMANIRPHGTGPVCTALVVRLLRVQQAAVFGWTGSRGARRFIFASGVSEPGRCSLIHLVHINFFD